MHALLGVFNGNERLDDARVDVPVELVFVFDGLLDDVLERVEVLVFDGWLDHGGVDFVRPAFVVVADEHLPRFVKVAAFGVERDQ